MDKIHFGYATKSEANLIFNMSYLSTIVHPLIIIRLLEHRLFTPLLKKTTNTRATPSVSLSMSAACSNAIGATLGAQSTVAIPLPAPPSASVPSTSMSQNSFLKTSQGDQGSNSSSSSAALHHKKSLQCGPSSPSGVAAAAQKRKCSEGYYNISPNEFESNKSPSQRKHSQASIFFSKNHQQPSNQQNASDSLGFDSEGNDSTTNSDSRAAGSPSHHHKDPSSKKTLLKDLSKKILRRVNSGNFSHHHHNRNAQQQQQREQQREGKKSIATSSHKPLFVPSNKTRKGSTSALNEVSTSEHNSSQVMSMLPVSKDAPTLHRGSISSIGPPMIELTSAATDHHSTGAGSASRDRRQSRSNTNSIDRNSHFRENGSNNDSYSYSNQYKGN
jgi:hypothetical protein